MAKGLQDISGYPLEEGMLVVLEAEGKDKYTIRIDAVERVDSNIRIVTCQVIQSNKESLPANTNLRVKLDSNIPTYGIVIAPVNSETGVNLSPVKVNAIVAIELKKFLDTREATNYGSSIDVALTYLTVQGLLSALPEDRQRERKKLVRIIKMRKDLFSARGGHVFSVGDDSEPLTSIGQNPVKVWDWRQIERMALALARSGIMGDVKIINLPEHLL